MSYTQHFISGNQYEFEYDDSIWYKEPSIWSNYTILRIGYEENRIIEKREDVLLQLEKKWEVLVWNPLVEVNRSIALFLFSSLWGAPNSSVDSYYKLWKKVKKNHPELKELEETIETENKLKDLIIFSGLSMLDSQLFPLTFNFVSNDRMNGLIALEDGTQIKNSINNLVSKSFHTDTPESHPPLNWAILVREILENGGIVVRPFAPPDFGAVYIDTFIKDETWIRNTIEMRRDIWTVV